MWGNWQSTDDIQPKHRSNNRTKVILAFAALLLLVSVVVYFSNKWNSEKVIKGLTVSGNAFIPAGEFSELVHDTVIKQIKERIRLKSIKNSIEKHPFIKSANVTFASNDNINADLNLRYPVAIFVNKTGDLIFVDNEGTLLPYRYFNSFTGLLVISGIFKDDKPDSSKMKDAMYILSTLNKIDNKFIKACVSQINYKSNDNSLEFYMNIDGLKVYFGTSYNLEPKLNKLENFMKYYLIQAKKPKVRYVDLRWANQVVFSEIAEQVQKN